MLCIHTRMEKHRRKRKYFPSIFFRSFTTQKERKMNTQDEHARSVLPSSRESESVQQRLVRLLILHWRNKAAAGRENFGSKLFAKQFSISRQLNLPHHLIKFVWRWKIYRCIKKFPPAGVFALFLDIGMRWKSERWALLFPTIRQDRRKTYF